MILTNESLSLSRGELAALVGHTSADITRAHLNSVCIDREAGRVCATDGHRLLVWTGEKSAGAQALLPAAALRGVLAFSTPAARRKSRRVALVPLTTDLTISLGETEATVLLPAGMRLAIPYTRDAHYPPIDAVVPRYKLDDAQSLAAVNPLYFVEIAKLAKVLCARLPGITVQTGPTDLDPFLVRFCGNEQWSAVIMPMRGERTWSANKTKAA